MSQHPSLHPLQSYKIIHLGKVCNMLMSHCKYDTWLIYANYDRINNRSNTLKNEEY